MNINISQLTDQVSEFRFSLKRSDLERLDSRFDFQTFDCYAKLRREQEIISLSGEYCVKFETECDTCLETYSFAVEDNFTLDLVHSDDFRQSENNFEVTLSSRDIEYYQGEDINLKNYFEDQVMLDLPYSFKCSEDCKGICSSCGINLNRGTCQCSSQNKNNPFYKLKDLV